MIRLNSIPQGLAVEYKKYRLKKLTNCLKQLIEKREKVAGTGVTNEKNGIAVKLIGLLDICLLMEIWMIQKLKNCFLEISQS